jgi:deazaflavin-dependent oxidoreductase (nitroreductase family)
MRRIFWFLNKFFMVPVFRLGFGPVFGNPFWGYIMVLRTTGRKSGKVRYSPVNYAIRNGKVYCMAGFGRASDWYRNLQANNLIDVILPSGPFTGTATEVSDPAERAILIRQILKNGGFAGFFEGFNPYRIKDEDLLERTASMPLVCLQPVGPANGPADPGGWAWVWTPVSLVILTLVIERLFR